MARLAVHNKAVFRDINCPLTKLIRVGFSTIIIGLEFRRCSCATCMFFHMARGLDGANIRSRQEISAGDIWNCPIDRDKTKRAIRCHERKRQGNRRCCSRVQDRRKVAEGEKTDGVQSQAHSGSEDIHHKDRTQGYNVLERAATRARNKYRKDRRDWRKLVNGG